MKKLVVKMLVLVVALAMLGAWVAPLQGVFTNVPTYELVCTGWDGQGGI